MSPLRQEGQGMKDFRYHRFESNGTRFCRVCMLRADHAIHRPEPEWIRRARERELAVKVDQP